MIHMKIFSGYLICSDVDGTFSVNTVTVKNNIEAVKYFTQNGGRFTIATGRTAAYLKNLDFFDCINAPVCICNGSVVYDYQKDEILQMVHQDFVLADFLDSLGNFLQTLDGLYVYYTPQTVQAPNMAGKEFKKEELISYPIKIVCTFDSVKKADEFKTYCIGHPLFKNTYISKSWDTGVEFNPANGTKGSAVEFIKAHLCDVHTSVAIGDYENDIPMLKKADISVAVGDGIEEVKNIAKITVDIAKNGAVADLIKVLEEKIKNGELQ